MSNDSLLSKKYVGGLYGGRGYSFEELYILSQLPKWLANKEIRNFQSELWSDIELFIVSGHRWLIQIKNHQVDLTEFREIMEEFSQRFQTSKIQYEKLTLVSTGLTKSVQEIINGLERWREIKHLEKEDLASTIDELKLQLKKRGLNKLSDFFLESIEVLDFQTECGWAKNEDHVRVHFISTIWQKFQIDTAKAENLYLELSKRLQLERGKSIELQSIRTTLCNKGIFSTDWESFAKSMSQEYLNWHIPSELQRFINEKIPFVPVQSFIRFKKEAKQSLFNPPIEGQDENIEYSLEDILKLNKNLLVLGSAGAGKSTLLRYLCHNFSSTLFKRDLVKIPILIRLRHYGKNDLRDLLITQLIHHGIKNADLFTKNFSEAPGWLFLFDGVDEIHTNYRQQFVDELIALLERVNNCQFIITSRKHPNILGLESFSSFEIQPLDNEGIFLFTKNYLDDDANKFLNHIHERNIWEILSTPLLLTLCLLAFKLGTIEFNTLDDIYSKIVEFYKLEWEDPKKPKRAVNPLQWDVLEKGLSLLAFQMLKNGLTYELERSEALEALSGVVQELTIDHRWPYQNTVDDFLDQLLFHNFLETFGNKINFWHPSFRDYFSAKQLATFDLEFISDFIARNKVSLVAAFTSGLFSNNKRIRKQLVKIALTDENPDWAIEALRVMEADTIYDMIGFAKENNDFDTLISILSTIDDRWFEGKETFDRLIQIESIIYDIEGGYLELEDYQDWFPKVDSINFHFYYNHRQKIFGALAEKKFEKSKLLLRKLEDYFENLRQSTFMLDSWLASKQINTVEDFQELLWKGYFDTNELKIFCRNTTLKSSLVYLAEIMNYFSDYDIKLEAHLGIQSLLRS